uniref:C-type lectin domain-containing protein n=1 Tax=Ciona savignyi TaxID=51511 RepID=H2YIG5_CIOSA
MGKLFVLVSLLVVEIAQATWLSFGEYNYSIEMTYVMGVEAANASCHFKNSTLAVIKNNSTQKFLGNAIPPSNNGALFYFIGLKRTGNGSNAFTWVDGSPISSGPTFWRPMEPSGIVGSQDCVMMYSDGPAMHFPWINVPCSYRARYICQRQRVPLSPTTSTVSSTTAATTNQSSKPPTIPSGGGDAFRIFAPAAVALGVVVLIVGFGFVIYQYFNVISARKNRQHRPNTVEAITRRNNLGNSQIIYRVSTADATGGEPSYQDIEVRVSICSVPNSEVSPSRSGSKSGKESEKSEKKFPEISDDLAIVPTLDITAVEHKSDDVYTQVKKRK